MRVATITAAEIAALSGPAIRLLLLLRISARGGVYEGSMTALLHEHKSPQSTDRGLDELINKGLVITNYLSKRSTKFTLLEPKVLEPKEYKKRKPRNFVKHIKGLEPEILSLTSPL